MHLGFFYIYVDFVSMITGKVFFFVFYKLKLFNFEKISVLYDIIKAI